MDYPEVVQDYIDRLDDYTENETLAMFHILHIYPDGLAYPDGYYDSQFFIVHGFNYEKMERRNLGKRDSLDMTDNVKVDMVRIFADGSTMIKFKHSCKVAPFQAARISAA